MADIRCSNCGKNNPDFFDVCQFCQSPLSPDAMVHIGEEPTKKDTGELEEILPDWLKDARKQGKNEETVDDAFRSQTKPKVPKKEEAPDLLAGLMSQAESDEDEVPDWLASINPVAEKKSPISKPLEKEEPSDFFAQFKEAEQKPPVPAESEPQQEDMSAWMGMEEKPAGQKDELTDWFSQTSAEQGTSFTPADSRGTAAEDNWMKDFESSDTAEEKTPSEKEPEDLSWLHSLEAASKETGDLSEPQQGFDFAAPSSDEDLNWLNNLGGTSAPSFEEPASSKPVSSDDDLNWLNNLGGMPAATFEEPAPSKPVSSDDDLNWLNNLGGTPAEAFEEPAPSKPTSSDADISWLNNLGGTPAEAFEEPAPSQPTSSEDDMSWLNNLGGTPAEAFEEPTPSQPTSSDADMSWLNNLGGTPAAAFEEPTPSQPTSSDGDMSWLNNLGGTPVPSSEESVPSKTSSSQDDLDWLSSLSGTTETSEPPSPAFADEVESQGAKTPSDKLSKPFRTAPLHELVGDEPIKDTTPDWLKSAMEEPSMPAPGAVSMDWFSEHSKPADAENVPTQDEPVSPQSAFDFSLGGSSTTSAQDVDSLFDVEMPDWLSREPENVETSQSGVASLAADDTLSPVELPSWVQAMRPVDSVIDESTAGDMEQVTESEGPLAGFQGVIPASPIGSSLRPKAFSLKLQITEEQQASAALLEQIITGETTVQPRKEAAGSTQNVLRWVLSALFILVLGVVLGLGLKTMPLVGSNELSNLVGTIPQSAPVLVVIDYEPSFTGELEASAGPLLDQLALSKRSAFSFISMSPNSSALVDRLMLKTGVNDLGYQPGEQYFNLGFLPGGSAGVLGFIENPADEFSTFEAVILMTDNAETGRVWVEQLGFAKSKYPALAGRPFIVVSSAQSAPLLQPYVSSGQVDIMVSGLSDAAKYEYVNNTRPGLARSYWDAFGIGLTMAIIAIIFGSLWSVLMRIRERRAEAEQV